MTHLPYGTLPTRHQWDEAFRQACPNGTFNIQMSTADSRRFGVYQVGKGHWLSDELWDAVYRIMDHDPDSLDIVGAILRTLGFEWVINETGVQYRRKHPRAQMSGLMRHIIGIAIDRPRVKASA